MDPRLAALYDGDNPDGEDHDYIRHVATDIGARTIIDVGCGTGILTVTLARPERVVYGVDPTPQMLAIARTRAGTEAVHWIDGVASDLPPVNADLAILSGNVAQHIPDGSWQETLGAIAARLRSGGELIFESRNPADRAWEDWTSGPASTRDTPFGPLREWMTLTAIHDTGEIELAAHNDFLETGDRVIEHMNLWFRSSARLRDDLTKAGFGSVSIFSDWHESPENETSRLFVIRAVRD